MPTKRSWPCSMAAAALLLAMLSGCASSSPTTPPVIGAKPQATPLPASVSQIDPRSSEAWLREVQSYFEAVDSSLSSETRK
ncbi:hypothetical protein VAPA_1c17240 [Variovorax paradoxus B4]|uniref:Lipoprotein n=1 Tax=Variovorax paradoxus B4 TaxID=1246301 RepID=T1X7C6_VARPD|nr:hypothetical protein [Variovorax paradoxus]AGU48832.1 hypothetical protein VAPA_1c17240 [Variovorax paradoxus B4]